MLPSKVAGAWDSGVLSVAEYMDDSIVSNSNSNQSSSGGPIKRSSKRLIFDRRYGWVLDEWKEPSEEALAGGRGMFCILPLANALVKIASQSINLAVSTAIKVVEKPDEFSPRALQANLNDGLKKFQSSLHECNFNPFTPKGNPSILSTSFIEHLESSESENS